MFERILIPLDGSELAESVIVQVRQVLRSRNSEILLVRVVTLPPSSEADAGEPLDVLWSRATEYMQNLSGRLTSEGLQVRPAVVEGFPAPAILRIARLRRATMIAMSTHGRSGLARWALGSVTEKIVRASPLPVLAMPSFVGLGGDSFPTGAQERPFKKIIAPISRAELSLEILPNLTEFARQFGSHVYLVNVCEGPECHVPIHEMRQAHERLKQAGISVEPVLRQGDVASQILDVCLEKGADLIAISTHGRSGPSRWVLGSVAEKVLRAASVPLLLHRPPKGARGR